MQDDESLRDDDLLRLKVPYKDWHLGYIVLGAGLLLMVWGAVVAVKAFL